jgi:hypothetical protein
MQHHDQGDERYLFKFPHLALYDCAEYGVLKMVDGASYLSQAALAASRKPCEIQDSSGNRLIHRASVT